MKNVLLAGVAVLFLAGEAAAQQAPAPLEASIVTVKKHGHGTELSFAAGTDDGVAAGWIGEIDGFQGTFAVLHCAPKRCTARSSIAMRVLKKSARRVRVWRP